MGCASKPVVDADVQPEQTEEYQFDDEPIISEPQSKEAAFDPSSVSQEIFDITKVNVQRYVDELNSIIRSKNYSAWKTNLSDEYFNEISNPEFLKRTSDWPILRRNNIVLNTPQDYFTNVVVPSRQNSKVDDIEFTGHNRVKVFTINEKNERLRLYDLERTGNTWKIIN